MISLLGFRRGEEPTVRVGLNGYRHSRKPGREVTQKLSAAQTLRAHVIADRCCVSCHTRRTRASAFHSTSTTSCCIASHPSIQREAMEYSAREELDFPLRSLKRRMSAGGRSNTTAGGIENRKAADCSAALRGEFFVELSSLRPEPERSAELRPSESRRRAGA
jgi:hypothetical protein